MSFISHMMSHTPPWVLALLAYLTWQGIRAMRPRVIGIGRVMLVPALFLLLGLATLFTRRLGADAWLAWGIALLVLLPIGWLTGPDVPGFDPANRLVQRSGSVIPLVRNICIFLLQYVFAVIAATHPDSHSIAVLAGRAVSGATSGYFLGWLLSLRGHLRAAPRVVLRPT